LVPSLPTTSMCEFSIASVNMRRRNEAMHALLNTNNEDDILCVQEPWFNRIGVARCDDKINGKDVLGGAANPQWELLYSYFSSSQRAKVMVYHRIHNRQNPFRKNHLRVTVRNDLVAHPSIMMVEVRAGSELWRVINFYNDVDDPSTIRTLLRLDLPSTIPTLLVGDFNIHSHSWSPLGWTPSPHAIPLEEWCATQTLSLLSVPRSLDSSRRERRARQHH
jgi:Endonuclease-reverse transcriptase